MEQLSGLVERVTFHNEDNGFCVLQVKARGMKDLVPLTGHAPAVSPGEYLTADGAWVNDRQYGKQFKADKLAITPPTSKEGIERYLGSGMVKGIGPGYAKRMVSVFGEKVLDIIEQEPARLLIVKGIGKGRLDRIVSGWSEQKVIKNIMLFLHDQGVSTSRAVRIYKTYGEDAVAKVRADPYRLAHDIRGIGFLSADKIAQNLGWSLESPQRIAAGIAHALWESTSDGHCGRPRGKLIEDACELLGVDSRHVDAALDLQLNERQLISESTTQGPVLYLPMLHSTETGIAQQLARIVYAPRQMQLFEVAALYERIKPTLGMTLSGDQERALLTATQCRATIITGGPGCGKTSLVNAVLRMFDAAGARMLLAAPTGRAAKRMAETSGREASTIHRMLGFKPGGGATYNESNPLHCDVLVVDECSMIDVFLMHALLKAVPAGAIVLFVGDIDQLPSVGPGNVLGDLIASGQLAVARLTKIFRQAEGSQIIQAAHAINRGALPEFSTRDNPGDFYFIEREAPEGVVTEVIDLVQKRLPAKTGLDAVRDIQVIAPTNKSATGVRSLNERLQAALNPAASNGGPSVERFGTRFVVGDKVMQTENDVGKQVFNGDIGFIEAIEDGSVLLNFGGRSVAYDPGELDQVQLAYAATVHKLQGSQAPIVVMALTTQHFALLERKLVYTGITRGQQLVVIVGQKKALSMAIRNTSQARRQTRLREALVQHMAQNDI